MSSLAIGLISAGCIFGGALLGLLLQGLLPEHHLRDTSKDTVKVVAGTIATLSALVLGLLVGSAKSSFDATNTAIIQNGAKVHLLDRALAAYGPETKDAREQLRRAVSAGIEMFWPEEKTPGREWQHSSRQTRWRRIQAKLRDSRRQLMLSVNYSRKRNKSATICCKPAGCNRAGAKCAPDAVPRGAAFLAHHAASLASDCSRLVMRP